MKYKSSDVVARLRNNVGKSVETILKKCHMTGIFASKIGRHMTFFQLVSNSIIVDTYHQTLSSKNLDFN